MSGVTRPITIAGGGLAGLSLGIGLLRRGAAVTLHEAGKYPRHRVCGEFISGVAESTLERLGIVGQFEDSVSLSTSRWFDADGQICSVPVFGRGLSRWTLDERLKAEFVNSGGILKTESRLCHGEQAVWATGRVRAEGNWIGVKCHVQGLPLAADLEMHVGANGYVGLAKVENGMVNVCGLFRRQKGIGGRDILFQCLRSGGLRALADRVLQASPDPSSFCTVAGFEMGRQAGPLFSIGDAAHMIPPFTGNGMAMAFDSAELALDFLLEYSFGKMSWQEAGALAARAQRKRFARRMRVAGWIQLLLTTRPLLVAALARRHAIPFNFLLRLLR